MSQWTVLGGIEGPSGVIGVPGDKSLGHRSVMFAAIANGTSLVRGLPNGEDVRSTLSVFKSLGVEIEELGSPGAVRVHGRGLGGLCAPEHPLDCGNSGTTMRLLSGLFSGVHGLNVTLVGDESLSARPMGRVVDPLEEMGAHIVAQGEGGTAPLQIRGQRPLRPIEYVSPVASAQVKSALFLAGLAGHATVRLSEPHLSRDHTERMLEARGCPVRRRGEWLELDVESGELPPMDTHVPGDISSAAFFMVLGAIGAGPEGILIENVGVNPTRTGVVDVLRQMGANVEFRQERNVGGEPVADLVVTRSTLRGIRVEGDVVPRCIDEIPILAVAGAFAEGTTSFHGVGELRVKETDRIHAMVTELRKMGVQLEEWDDGFSVTGGGTLLGAEVTLMGDHRIAMALAVAGVFAADSTCVSEAESADISFPEFTDTLCGLFPKTAPVVTVKG